MPYSKIRSHGNQSYLTIDENGVGEGIEVKTHL